MLQYLNQKRGQSTLEYAVLICIIIGALISIQIYLKRGIQGRLKKSADDIGDQFSPGNTNEVSTTTTNSSSTQTFSAGVSNSIISNESTNTSDNASIMNVQQEYWGKDGGG